MTATETVLVNGEPVEVRRLSAADELEARQDAVFHRYGTELSDDDFDFRMSECRVYYRDDLDAGVSEYCIDDDAGGYAEGWRRVGE